MPKATRKNMCLDLIKSRGYLSGDDVTWTGEDAPDHIWKWYQDMMLAEQYNLKRLLNEDAAHDVGSTVGDVLDLIQDIQEESEKSTGWGRFRGIGIEFIKIAMAEIPIVGGTLGAIDGLYAMYEAGKKEEHAWKDIEEYPILRRIKMHPQLMKVLDDMVLRKIDAAYKEYLATLGRDTLVSQITDIDVFTHKWVMEETEETIDVAVISELRQYIRSVLKEEKKVLGYIKPDSAFFTLSEWEYFCNRMLELQKQGFDTRGGGMSLHSEVMSLVNKYFGFQLNTEVSRYDLLTHKNVMDFIEDFVNHRFWGIQKEFGHYFKDIRKLRIAYFYSRGDIEPYALIDDEFTIQLYGSTYNPKPLMHYTTEAHALNMEKVIDSGQNTYDISAFTVAERPFFRESSNYIVEFIGNVRAGFRSDIKSFATSSGRRAVNLYRLEYPGKDLNNICYELESCDGSVRTSLWNEYIATPLEIISIRVIT